jgi:hypothetical protein
MPTNKITVINKIKMCGAGLSSKKPQICFGGMRSSPMAASCKWFELYCYIMSRPSHVSSTAQGMPAPWRLPKRSTSGVS